MDGDGGAERFCEQYERRRFHLSRTMDGMWRGDFVVDPEAGATMQTILQTVGGPQPKSDDRRAAQFRADALFDVFRLAGKHATSKPGVRKPRADFTAVLTLDEIERRDPNVAIAIRQSPHGLSRATLDRLTCDCNITRVITDGPSRVLDVGRTTRVWPDAIRRAIETPRRWLHHTGLHPRSRMVRHPPPQALGRRRRNQHRQRRMQMPPPPHQRTRSQPRPALTKRWWHTPRRRVYGTSIQLPSHKCRSALVRPRAIRQDVTKHGERIEADHG